MADDDKLEPAAEGAKPQAEPAVDEKAELQKLAADLKDRFLRAVAETENVRKRAEREVADARSYAIANFARDAISVADNLNRVLEAVAADAKTAADPALKALLEGVELTEREFQKTLAKHGVKQLDPTGEKFDPNFHQAMFEVPDQNVPAGMVVQVMQTGYAIGDRVLRPALVGVSKGGAKMPPKESSANNGKSGEDIEQAN
jgi:molecular chaperone GrpE